MMLFEQFVKSRALPGAVLPGRVIEPLFHGSKNAFLTFDTTNLGSNNPDVMSMFGVHFTPDRVMCESLFCQKGATIYTVELAASNIWRSTESEIVRSVLEHARQRGTLPDALAKRLMKLPYFSSTSPCYISSMPRAVKRYNLNLRALVDDFKAECLTPQGIDTIEYLNEIEWARDMRYDFLTLDPHNVTIRHQEEAWKNH